MMTYELDDLEKEILLGKVVERARADLNDGRPLTEMATEKKAKETQMKFWAYRHVDGSIHVKAYRDDMPNARASIDDAFESDFVDDVLDPFPANGRAEAERIAKLRLDNLRTAQSR